MSSEFKKFAVGEDEYLVKDERARETLSNLSSVVSQKVDKISGMGLSHCDYTADEKEKLGNLDSGDHIRSSYAASMGVVDNQLVLKNELGESLGGIDVSYLETTYGLASVDSHGLLSKYDKRKIDELEELGPEFSYDESSESLKIGNVKFS